MAKVLMVVLGIILMFGSVANAGYTDVVQYPTGNFVNPSDPMGNYRWFDQDWGWQHKAYSGNITSASLSVAAWDVDWSADSDGEHDVIYAYDNGVKTLLGELNGANDQWAWTTFTLGPQFYDDIKNGLQVFMDIDSTHTYDYWAVSLSKSALSINEGELPPPNPVPEPATCLMIASGLAGLAFAKRRFSK